MDMAILGMIIASQYLSASAMCSFSTPPLLSIAPQRVALSLPICRAPASSSLSARPSASLARWLLLFARPPLPLSLFSIALIFLILLTPTLRPFNPPWARPQLPLPKILLLVNRDARALASLPSSHTPSLSRSPLARLSPTRTIVFLSHTPPHEQPYSSRLSCSNKSRHDAHGLPVEQEAMAVIVEKYAA
ncbi:hypothetical protein B0H14DRAFT_3511873 [Mycena olivaceomarginata]|nr:hypothetical protein B0H14DRAFT_3511873 [Mycena olivaceomarginata]